MAAVGTMIAVNLSLYRRRPCPVPPVVVRRGRSITKSTLGRKVVGDQDVAGVLLTDGAMKGQFSGFGVISDQHRIIVSYDAVVIVAATKTNFSTIASGCGAFLPVKEFAGDGSLYHLMILVV
jgi:hypothetical protein